MLHKADITINAAKLTEDPVQPEILQILKLIRPTWLPGCIQAKVRILFSRLFEGKKENNIIQIHNCFIIIGAFRMNMYPD